LYLLTQAVSTCAKAGRLEKKMSADSRSVLTVHLSPEDFPGYIRKVTTPKPMRGF
jgi:hypothetical protein